MTEEIEATEETEASVESSGTDENPTATAGDDSNDLDVTAEALAEANDAIAEEAAIEPQDDSAENSTSETTDPVSLKSERDKYFDQWRRTQAELENFRKRVQREAELAAKFASLPLIRDLLPALDNVGRTVQAAEQTSNVDELIQGLQMILKQFDDAFALHSATPIKAVGEMFDPNLHEALQQIPTDEHPPMTIVQELERGYLLDDRVIRPSKVLVAVPLPEAASDSENDESDQGSDTE
jgi:molecular chaperone GrpE